MVVVVVSLQQCWPNHYCLLVVVVVVVVVVSLQLLLLLLHDWDYLLEEGLAL